MLFLQNEQLKQFYNHYYSTDAKGLSPWNEQMVALVLPLMKKIEPQVLDEFNNQDKSADAKHYAENFKEHDHIWWGKIKENMDLSALNTREFRAENRAISVANTLARALPEGAPDFYHASLPGQGFPFDNLQESAVWAGTPLYVLSTSKDKAWSLVLTPDGWGGAYFYNDCSSEMKSIFVAFGIWLPRNSAQQAVSAPGLDLSESKMDERLKILQEKAHPLMTIIYIGGHVMLYIGNKDVDNRGVEAITYQNIWGMVPGSRDKRYVIGQSVFFPLLKNYPEYPDVISQADKPIFKLLQLDALNQKPDSPKTFIAKFMDRGGK